MEIQTNSMNQLVHYDGSNIYEENIIIDSNLRDNQILNDCIMKLSLINFNMMQFDKNILTRQDFMNLQNLEISIIRDNIIRLQNINFQTKIKLNDFTPRQKYVTLV